MRFLLPLGCCCSRASASASTARAPPRAASPCASQRLLRRGRRRGCGRDRCPEEGHHPERFRPESDPARGDLRRAARRLRKAFDGPPWTRRCSRSSRRSFSPSWRSAAKRCARSSRRSRAQPRRSGSGRQVSVLWRGAPHGAPSMQEGPAAIARPSCVGRRHEAGSVRRPVAHPVGAGASRSNISLMPAWRKASPDVSGRRFCSDT